MPPTFIVDENSYWNEKAVKLHEAMVFIKSVINGIIPKSDITLPPTSSNIVIQATLNASFTLFSYPVTKNLTVLNVMQAFVISSETTQTRFTSRFLR